MKKPRLSKDKLQPKPKKKFTIHRIEDKDGKEDSKEMFEGFKRPFDMDNRDCSGNNLVDRYCALTSRQARRRYTSWEMSKSTQRERCGQRRSA